MAVTLLITLIYLALFALADEIPFFNNAKYNYGDYGTYVTQTFISNPSVTAVPVVNFMGASFSDPTCDDGSYLFVAPRGNKADSTPMILDTSGSPIWASTHHYGEVYNLQVQEYKGQSYLTFWGGNDAVGGHGIGEYFMLDQNYNQQYRISAANGLGADLHAFTVTPDNTALITIYQKIAVDISTIAPPRGAGWIWDSVFQELDIETGEAIFEWRASTHIPLTNSYQNINQATEQDPWDAYHINSVEKDDLGNYLISVRFLRALIYIDGRTGDVLWQLGGKSNSFADLSNGKATSFTGQHDAHWHDGHRYITFFNNGADWDHKTDDQSKGIRVEVDLEQMTAKLDATFMDSHFKILSTSQGSYQTLPNGHVVLGYGFNGVMAEFSADGKLLCDAYLQPASTFGSGDVQSYRNLKFNWTAFPDTEPNLALDDSKLYMSWNGATEIATWLLLGSDSVRDEDDSAPHEDPRALETAVIVGKTGFETVHELFPEDNLRRYLRAIALDKDARPLGTSNVVDIGNLAGTSEGQDYTESGIEDESEYDGHDGDDTYIEEGIEDLQVLVGFGVFAVLSACLVLLLAVGKDRFAESFKVPGPAATFSNSEKRQSWKARITYLFQRIRSKIPGLRRKDAFSDHSAKEGLLAQDDLRLAEQGNLAAGSAAYHGMGQGIIRDGRS